MYIGIVDYFPSGKITASNFLLGEVIHYTNIHTGQYLYNTAGLHGTTGIVMSGLEQCHRNIVFWNHIFLRMFLYLISGGLVSMFNRPQITDYLVIRSPNKSHYTLAGDQIINLVEVKCHVIEAIHNMELCTVSIDFIAMVIFQNEIITQQPS